MKNSINLFEKIIYFLFFLSLVFYILSSLYQPLIGDDYILKYNVLNNNLLSYFKNEYLNHTGRFLQIFLAYLIFSNEILLIFLKLLSIPIFIIIIWLGWFCATGKFIQPKDKDFWKFISFLSLVWMSTPSIAENVIWTTGFITWLYPLFFSLIYLTLIFNFYYSATKHPNVINYRLSWKSIFYIILGFIAGSSIEQLSCIIFVVSSLVLLKFKIDNKKSKVPLDIYIGTFFLIIGILFLIFAPGNYQRLDTFADVFYQKIYKYLIYIFSGYYSLGAENAGKIFFLSLISLTLILNPEIKYKKERLQLSTIWLLGSFLSLVVMFPVTSFLSTRTTFFAIIFFHLFWLSLNYHKIENVLFKDEIKKIVILFIMSSLLLIDSLIGFATNKSLFDEHIYRYELIENAKSNNSEVKVPFFTTIPSRLTHMHNPEHDKQFLKILSSQMNIKIKHDYSFDSPLPNTKNVLKEIKNILNK